MNRRKGFLTPQQSNVAKMNVASTTLIVALLRPPCKLAMNLALTVGKAYVQVAKFI